MATVTSVNRLKPEKTRHWRRPHSVSPTFTKSYRRLSSLFVAKFQVITNFLAFFPAADTMTLHLVALRCLHLLTFCFIIKDKFSAAVLSLTSGNAPF